MVGRDANKLLARHIYPPKPLKPAYLYFIYFVDKMIVKTLKTLKQFFNKRIKLEFKKQSFKLIKKKRQFKIEISILGVFLKNRKNETLK